MSDCCSADEAAKTPRSCPHSDHHGSSVPWLTVAALTRGRLPARQAFWLCPDGTCDVVYFGADGTCLSVDDLRVHPGFKRGGDLLCYCFLHRRSQVARELSETGSTSAFDAIREEVRAGACACEVRNPTGKCCLAEVRAAIAAMVKEQDRESSEVIP